MHESATRRHVEDQIRRMLGAFRNPIVVFDEGWAQTMPDWLKSRIAMERLMQLMTHEEGKATRAEAVAYLYTASLRQPLSADWTDIYCHLGAEYARQRGIAIPQELAPECLTPDQSRELDHLLAWLWRKSSAGPQHRQFSAAHDEQLTLF